MQDGGVILSAVRPNNIEAERSVLGSILTEPSTIEKVALRLKPSHFYNGPHQAVYEACLLHFEQGKPIDAVSIAQTLREMDKVFWEPKASYLLEIQNWVPTALNIEYYADILLKLAKKRTAIGIAEETIAASFSDQNDAEEIVGRTLEKFYNLASDRIQIIERLGEGEVDRFVEHVRGLRDSGTLPGLSYPWSDLTSLLGGLRPSEMTVVCGRPGQGKTSFGLNIADYLARKKGIPVGIISLEMSKKMLVTRLIAQVAGLNARKVRDGKLTDDEWQQFLVAAKKVGDCPIWVDDYPILDQVTLLTKAREMRHKANIQILILDYIQLMEGSGDNREQEVSGASKAVRRIAREFEIPVIALAQLNRGPEGRADKRPLLSDLRESGGIENEADCVLGIYRDDYYNGTESKFPGTAEIIVLKHRNGEDGKVFLKFSKALTQFQSIEFKRV